MVAPRWTRVEHSGLLTAKKVKQKISSQSQRASTRKGLNTRRAIIAQTRCIISQREATRRIAQFGQSLIAKNKFTNLP